MANSLRDNIDNIKNSMPKLPDIPKFGAFDVDVSLTD